MINCLDGNLIHDVVGYVGWDIYATLHGHILDLSGTLQSQVSLLMMPFGEILQTPWWLE